MNWRADAPRCVSARGGSHLDGGGHLEKHGDPAWRPGRSELPAWEQQTKKGTTAAEMLLNHLLYPPLHLHTSPVYLLHLQHAIRQAREVSVTKTADILSKLSAAGDEMLQWRCYQPCELWKHFRKHEWLAPSNASSERREVFEAKWKTRPS